MNSILLVMREMQIKTTMRGHYTPTKMVLLENPGTIKLGEIVEQLEFLAIVDWCKYWQSHFWKTTEGDHMCI